MAIYQAPPATAAFAVRSSCLLPRNNTSVAINPNTAAALSQIPGASCQVVRVMEDMAGVNPPAFPR